MKKAVFFTVADKNNLVHAEKLIKSLRKFHSEEEIDTKIFTEKDIGETTNYYRQKPMFARELINQYELVIGADADQIITGNLDYIFTEPYDVGTVLNWNAVDEKMYGFITTMDIPPRMYVNCGLVAMRNKNFVEHWWNLCNSYHFNNLRYREQDILNVIAHYGEYDIECFDFPNQVKNYQAWHGLIAKGHYLDMVVRDGKLVLPAKNGYPEVDKEIKVLHSAGGGNEPKVGDAFRTQFSEDVINYIAGLIQ